MVEDDERNPEPGYHRYLLESQTDPKDEQIERVMAVVDELKALVTAKNNTYVISPIETLPMESWLHQVRIKAERALHAKSPEKRDEELKDCAVYCILALAKNRQKEKV